MTVPRTEWSASPARATFGTLPVDLLWPGMAACLGAVDALDAPLRAEERPGTDGMAPVRWREYVAGRTAARRAIVRLTGRETAVPRRADRSPGWPAGLCGSLSHTRSYAVAVVAHLDDYAAIGVDLETDAGVDRDLWDQIFTETEKQFLRNSPPAVGPQAANLLFSAKEAYFKCLPRSLQRRAEAFDFHHLEISIDFSTRRIAGSVAPGSDLPERSGRFTHFDGHWITLFSDRAGPRFPLGPSRPAAGSIEPLFNESDRSLGRAHLRNKQNQDIS